MSRDNENYTLVLTSKIVLRIALALILLLICSVTVIQYFEINKLKTEISVQKKMLKKMNEKVNDLEDEIDY